MAARLAAAGGEIKPRAAVSNLDTVSVIGFPPLPLPVPYDQAGHGQREERDQHIGEESPARHVETPNLNLTYPGF
jgi:hypothetical protein